MFTHNIQQNNQAIVQLKIDCRNTIIKDQAEKIVDMQITILELNLKTCGLKKDLSDAIHMFENIKKEQTTFSVTSEKLKETITQLQYELNTVKSNNVALSEHNLHFRNQVRNKHRIYCDRVIRKKRDGMQHIHDASWLGVWGRVSVVPVSEVRRVINDITNESMNI
jgi:FtsZ-binding cell division protein ZapB